MTRLIINARFLTQPITGVQRYAIEISRQIKIIDPNTVFVSPPGILHESIADELDVKIVGKLKGHLWEQIELPLYLIRQPYSPLLLNLANTAPLYYKNKIIQVHDISFKRFPKSFSWKFRRAYGYAIPRILKNSKLIITDSEFSREEIISFYKTPKDKVRIIHCATSSMFSPNKKTKTDSYILAVSSLSFQKNFHSLIKAFNDLKDKSIKLRLVGSINKNFADHQLLKDMDNNDNIEFVGRVDDITLRDLYSNAICFVYPSLYEGFGIPPIEAQACGCPCIVSNVSSLPEVCGDSVLYFNPNDISDITRKIEALISSPTMQADLISKGYDNILRFSWEKSAFNLLELVKHTK